MLASISTPPSNQSHKLTPRARNYLPVVLVGSLILSLIGYLTYILYFDIPTLENLYLWFIPRHFIDINFRYIYLALGALSLATLVALSSSKTWVKLFLIFIAGMTIHYSFGVSKGSINYIKDRMVNTGHASYVRLAASTPDIYFFLSNFESLAKSGTLGDYAPSKPPGTSLIYLFTDRLLSTTDENPKTRATRIIDFSTYTWPAISYLPIFLIFLFGRNLIGQQNAIIAALLYATTPSMSMINLHTDQTFYPLAGLLCGFALFKAFAENKVALAFLAGVLFFLVSYLSFGMLPLAVVFFGALVLYYKPSISAKLISVFAIGFLLPLLALYLAFDYNFYTRYVLALAKHHNTKGWEGTWQVFRDANITNVIEYYIWLGIPIATCFLYGVLSSWKFFKTNRLYFLLTFSLLASIALIIMFGKTKSETARLWMYLNPYVCLIAAMAIHSLSLQKNILQKGLVIFIVLGQFFVDVLLLRYQDFY